jgi:hypothetical protein
MHRADGSSTAGQLAVPAIANRALSTTPNLRFRAAQTLVLFTTATVVAIALVAPQPDVALGLELLGWAVVSAIVMFVLDRRAGHGPEERAARFVGRFSPNGATSILLAIAAGTSLAKADGGLYWLLPTVAASLFGASLARGSSPYRRTKDHSDPTATAPRICRSAVGLAVPAGSVRRRPAQPCLQ